MDMNLNKNRYLKFLIVGAIGVIPNWIVFNMLKGLNLNVAWLLGIVAGATSNYVLNEVWVFGE